MRLSHFLPVAALLAASCSHSGWQVRGDIAGAGDTTLVVEAQDNGRWYPLDTVAVRGGSFSYTHPAVGYPDVYRLTLGGRSLYFPVDSVETVTVATSLRAFGGAGTTLSGSPETARMMRADSLVALRRADRDKMKRELAQLMLVDPAGITSYYIINKSVDGAPLFDPRDHSDLKIIGAVANAFAQQRPRDPRTKHLTNLYLDNRRARGAAVRAQQVRAFEIALYDEQGVKRSLLDETAKGRVVVLNFTLYGAEASPAYNVALNKVYQKYRDRGLEIFQVSLDQDQHLWKASAQNLPWITVLDPMTDGGKSLRQYNVSDLPATYVFNRQGDIAARADDPASLDAEVAKLL